MRLARVLTHLAVLAAVALGAQAAIEEDAIFQSAVGRTCFRTMLRESGWGLVGPNERAAFIIEQSDGSFTCEEWPSIHSYLSEKFYGPMPAHTVAIAHTHPAQYPRPSLQDQEEAVRLGIPIYTISIRAVYKSTPDRLRTATLTESQSWIREVPLRTASTAKATAAGSP